MNLSVDENLLVQNMNKNNNNNSILSQYNNIDINNPHNNFNNIKNVINFYKYDSNNNTVYSNCLNNSERLH